MMREDELSSAALAVLFVLRWESLRDEPVTVTEIVRRLGMTQMQAKDAVGELYTAGFLSVEPAHTPAEGNT